MDFNFFTWLREGVRRSVLLGVSDAVEDLGAPNDGEIHPSLAEAGLTGAIANQRAISGKSTRRSSGGGKKRLGKSLTEIDGSKS